MAIGASVFISIISAVVFTRGMRVVEEGWVSDIVFNGSVYIAP